MDYPIFNIYIVDNYSDEKDLSLLKTWGQSRANFHEIDDTDISGINHNSINLIALTENLGFGGGNNIILEQLISKNAELIWLINPDMLVSENNLIELVNADSGVQIQATPTYNAYKKDELMHLGVAKIRKTSATVEFVKNSAEGFDYVNGGSMFFSSEVLKVLGLMPEQYFLYWEETHWCRMAREKRIELKINFQSRVWDKGSTTIGKGTVAEYYYTRNGLMYRKEFEPGLLLINFLMHLLRFALRILSFRFKRANGILLGLVHFLFAKTGKM